MRGTPWTRRRGFRSPIGAVATLVAIALLAVVAALFWPPPAALSGQARAVDGDTLRIGDSRVRLVGLDAVELDQNCRDASGGWRWRKPVSTAAESGRGGSTIRPIGAAAMGPMTVTSGRGSWASSDVDTRNIVALTGRLCADICVRTAR